MAEDPDDDRTPDADDDPVGHYKARFAIAEERWQENRREGLDDFRFGRLQEQWPEKIRRDREREGRPCLTLDQLHAFIFQVVNDARQNKPGIVVHPVGDGADVETAQAIEGLIRHIEQSSDAEVAYDTGMDGAVSGGFGYWRVNTRYACDDNFDQDLTIERIADAFSVYPDPNSTAADSADWNECFVLQDISARDFKKRWPKKDAVSFEAERREIRLDLSDEDMIVIAEAWTRKEVKRTIVSLSPVNQDGDPEMVEKANALVGDQLIVGLDVYNEHKDLFDALGVTIKGQRDVMSYEVTQELLSGANVLETVEWAGKYIPIIPVYGEEVLIEGKRVLRSLIRGAKDAQRNYNYWRTTETELVALAPRAPFIGKVGQFTTDASKWATANIANHAFIEYDAPEQGDAPPPQRQPFAGVPAGALQAASGAQNDIKTIIGIYNASLGAPSNETSGVAINARDQQADTGTFHFIDNLSRAIRHTGRVLIDLIPKVYSTPRMLRILGPDGKPTVVAANQPVPVMGPDGQPQTQQDPITGELRALERVMDLTVGKYDLVVKAGPSFATKREELKNLLLELIRADKQMAPMVMDLIVKNYDIPDADEIVQRLEAMLPPQIKGQDPQLQQAHQQIQQMGQALQAAKQQLDQLKGEQADRGRKLDIEAFDAETDRLKVFVGNQGVPADLSQIAPMVAASVMHILTSPDILQAAQGGATPDQIGQMLAQRMQGAQPPQAPPIAA